jgi:hypothetical protein
VQWKVRKVRKAHPTRGGLFMNSREDILNQKLQKIISWAKINNFLWIQGDGPGSIISLCGKTGGIIVTFYEKSIYKGVMYAYIADGTFPGNAGERDAFVDELKKINLYDMHLDASTVPSHRHFRRKLQELTDEEIDKLLTILGKYCG